MTVNVNGASKVVAGAVAMRMEHRGLQRQRLVHYDQWLVPGGRGGPLGSTTFNVSPGGYVNFGNNVGWGVSLFVNNSSTMSLNVNGGTLQGADKAHVNWYSTGNGGTLNANVTNNGLVKFGSVNYADYSTGGSIGVASGERSKAQTA